MIKYSLSDDTTTKQTTEAQTVIRSLLDSHRYSVLLMPVVVSQRNTSRTTEKFLLFYARSLCRCQVVRHPKCTTTKEPDCRTDGCSLTITYQRQVKLVGGFLRAKGGVCASTRMMISKAVYLLCNTRLRTNRERARQPSVQKFWRCLLTPEIQARGKREKLKVSLVYAPDVQG